MLERTEGEKPGADVDGINAARKRERRGGERVLDVVLAGDREVVLVHELNVAAVKAHDEHAVGTFPRGVRGCALRGLARGKQMADAQATCLAAHGDVTAPGVSVGDDGEVSGVHVPEEALLGGGVVLHRLVPIEVVRRDVEQHAHVGMQLDRSRKLEARELGHEPLAGSAPGDLADGHRSDVADRLGGKATRAKEVAGEGGRRGLAVGAGDANPALGALAPGKLGLADDLLGGSLTTRVEVAELGDARGGDREVEVALDVLGAVDNLRTLMLEGERLVRRGALGAAHHGHGTHPAIIALGEKVLGNGLSRLAKAKDADVPKLAISHVKAPFGSSFQCVVRPCPLPWRQRLGSPQGRATRATTPHARLVVRRGHEQMREGRPRAARR